LIVAAGILPTAAAWFYFVRLDGDPRAPAVYVATKLLQFSLPLVWLVCRRREGGAAAPRGAERARRGSTAAGRAAGRTGGLVAGVATGAALAAAILAAWWLLAGSPLTRTAAPRIAAKVESFRASGPLGYLVLAALLAGLHSGLEEIYWRWLVFGGLRRWTGDFAALVVSSLLFMAHHVVVVGHYLADAGAAWVAGFSLLVAAGGAVWAELYRRTGSLVPPWISHVFADAALLWIGWQLVRA
jgi:membrane protease YdiL (CAAX protease family)